MDKPVTLLIPGKIDIEFEQVFNAWIKRGGQVKKLDKYWIKDKALEKLSIAIYGNQTFALVLAQIYNVELISPDDVLVARLENKWTKRIIQLKQVDQILADDFPAFIKPVIPKLFPAGIFKTLANFKETIKGTQNSDEILISNIIDDIKAEARSYILNGHVNDIALYEGYADLETGQHFLQAFIKENIHDLPPVVVIDIAFAEQTGWFVLEFNACWGSGLNNCKAEKVIDCIIGATVNN